VKTVFKFGSGLSICWGRICVKHFYQTFWPRSGPSANEARLRCIEVRVLPDVRFLIPSENFYVCMSDKHSAEMSMPFLVGVILLMVVLPASCALVEWLIYGHQSTFIGIAGKWLIFWAVGARLLIAGVRQVVNPSFTAKNIFHIDDSASHAIVKELGFANICFGAIGIISFFLPQWRIVSAFGSGLFYGIAGINHIVRKPAGPNEVIALVSDVLIFLLLLAYVLLTLRTS
jgi:hypothetical protein